MYKTKEPNFYMFRKAFAEDIKAGKDKGQVGELLPQPLQWGGGGCPTGFASPSDRAAE